METNEKNESILYSLENLLLTENDESNELLHLLEDFDLFLKDENDLFDYDVDSLVRCQLNHNFLEKTQGVLQNFENLYKKSQLIHDEIEKDYQSVLQMEDCVVKSKMDNFNALEICLKLSRDCHQLNTKENVLQFILKSFILNDVDTNIITSSKGINVFDENNVKIIYDYFESTHKLMLIYENITNANFPVSNLTWNQIKQKVSVLFQTSCETVCEWLKSLLSNQTYIDNYDYISLESGLHILAYNKDFLKICFDAYGKCQSEALISEITEFEHNLKSKIESKSSDPPISIDKTTKEDAIIRYISDLIAHIHQLIDSKLFIFSQIFKVFFENSDYKENDYIELLLKECILNIFNDMLIFLQLNIMKTVKNQKNIILTFKISTRIYLHENLLRIKKKKFIYHNIVVEKFIQLCSKLCNDILDYFEDATDLYLTELLSMTQLIEPTAKPREPICHLIAILQNLLELRSHEDYNIQNGSVNQRLKETELICMKFVSACIKFTWSLNDTISFGVSHVTGINELTFVNESIALYDLIEGYTNQIDKNIDIFVRYFTKMLVNHVSNSLFGKMKIFLDNSESFLYENFLLQIEGVQQKMQSYSQDSSTFYNAEYFLIANKNISGKIKKDCDGTILQSFRMFTKLCIDKNGICLSEYDSCQNVVLNLKNH